MSEYLRSHYPHHPAVRRERAESVLYAWACERVSTGQAKRQCEALGYRIDFRQPECGNRIEAMDTRTGGTVELRV